MTDYNSQLDAAVAALGALPMPAGPVPPPADKPRWQVLRTDLVAQFYRSMTVTAARSATDALDKLILELGAPGLAARDGAEADR